MGQQPHRRTRLARLRGDVAGNTLAMMAISLIPVSALAGSAVDMARLYVVKVRLQQACDAGVLAGRKFMTNTAAPELEPGAHDKAVAFFDNNFPKTGWMRTTDIQFTPTKTANNRVAGAAQVTVPMTIMKMFKADDVTLNATCEARFDVADTDIMFVLDTTGSMACKVDDDEGECSSYVGDAGKTEYKRPTESSRSVTPGYANTTAYKVNEAKDSRISVLRTAVIDFWQTMADNIQSTTKIRYGFVTYTSSVNAGAAVKAVSPSSLIGGNGSETSSYQTRHVTADYDIKTTTTIVTALFGDKAKCELKETRSPATALTYDANGEATFTTRTWDLLACTQTVRTVGPRWRYENWPQNVQGYVGGTEIDDPTSVTGGKTVWLGCLEELDASRSGQSSFDVKNLPPNLNPDLIPTSGDRWRPLWPDVTYQRTYTYTYWDWGWRTARANTRDAITTDGNDDDTAPNMNSATRQKSGNVSCGKPVQRMAELSKEQISAYVNASDFAPLGGTYHDTGMLWGLRMLSRDGIFATDNQAAPGRTLPRRVMVFLTDGDMAPSSTLYGLYGMEFWDRRVANGDNGNLRAYHNARFTALCEKAEEMQIDVWTVSITSDDEPTTELKNCASSTDQAFAVDKAADLKSTFVKIAKAVARLRLSQ